MSTEPLLPESANCSFDFEPRGQAEYLLPQLSVKRSTSNELIVFQEGAWQRTWIVRWGRRKVVDPLFLIIQRGLEPKLLSLSAALGLTLGVFPICGVTLLLCAAAALILRSKCHVPTLMLGNFVASFFELGLLVPFMRVGEFVTGGDHYVFSKGGFWEAIRMHEPHALAFGLLHAIIGWTVFAPISVFVLYICLLPLFQILTARFAIAKLLQHRVSQNDISSPTAGQENIAAPHNVPLISV